MKEFQFIKDYMKDEGFRMSFFELAQQIFGLNFKKWYEKGFWGDQYIPFSFVDGNKVVANVSVNIIDFIIQGKKYKALQIGTVMTHPEYRNRGLSSRLMNKVLEEYKDQYNFMYLFANDTVLDFYPKFGFREVDEYKFSLEYTVDRDPVGGIRKLDVDKKEDLEFLFQVVKDRIPVSKVFATSNSQSITMYHCLNVFNHNLYYHEQEDAIVIFQKNRKQLDIYDIISKREVNMESILSSIADKKTNHIVYHYTPDFEGHKLDSLLYKREGALFVKTNHDLSFPLGVKHPITSEA